LPVIHELRNETGDPFQHNRSVARFSSNADKARGQS
jgi:hypothetical protein